MASGVTYTPIQSQTLGSNSGNVTFSSIPSTYTDLVIVCNVAMVSLSKFLLFNFNADTGANYSYTALFGNGTSASSSRATSQTYAYATPDNYIDTTLGDFNAIINVQNYANTTTYKTAISRSNNATIGTATVVSLWRSTAAINQVVITDYSGNNFKAGSTFTLYGIQAA